MIDITEAAKNRVNTCIADSFGPLIPQTIAGDRWHPVTCETGALLQSNGDVIFRVFAPRAKSVVVNIRNPHEGVELSLQKQENGVFEGLLPFHEHWIGVHNFHMKIDGVDVVDPRSPFFFRGGKISNYVEIPEPGNTVHLIKNVPHGSVSYELYWSDVVGDWQRCMVYTPAEYRHEPEKQYPVLYLHHGWGENETSWIFAAKVPQVLDNLIAEGKCEPMIVVTNNNMPKTPADGTHGIDGYIKVLTEECIPFIEREFRVKADKWNRAIAGNSYGAMISAFLAFSRPELFGSFGMLSGGIRCTDIYPKLEDNWQLKWLVGGADKFREAYDVFFQSNGLDEYNKYNEIHDNEMIEDAAFLAENKIDQQPNYNRIIYPRGGHDWDTFRRGFTDFVPLLFRKQR